MDMNKITWTLLILVAAAVLFFGIFFLNSPFENTNSNPSPSSTPTANPSTTPVSSVIKGLSLTNVTPNTSYGQAVNQYKSKLMQFDATCHPQPYPNLVIKNGGNIMFDNRSGKAITLSLDGQKINFKTNGWTVLAMKSSALPHKVVIDCNTGQNYGSILIEK